MITLYNYNKIMIILVTGAVADVRRKISWGYFGQYKCTESYYNTSQKLSTNSPV